MEHQRYPFIMSVAATLMYFAESEVIVGLDTHTHTHREKERAFGM